jgi:undecaprenol kinase
MRWFMGRVRSFRHALDGLCELCRTEQNFRIHIWAAVVVVIAATFLGFDAIEWLFLVLAIGLVLLAEAFNSALERLIDLVQPKEHPLAKHAKDIGAAAVLIASIVTVMIGIILMINHILR